MSRHPMPDYAKLALDALSAEEQAAADRRRRFDEERARESAERLDRLVTLAAAALTKVYGSATVIPKSALTDATLDAPVMGPAKLRFTFAGAPWFLEYRNRPVGDGYDIGALCVKTSDSTFDRVQDLVGVGRALRARERTSNRYRHNMGTAACEVPG